MAGWDDVAEIALGLPEVAEEPIHGMRAWKVRKKLFVWERPLRAKEIEQLGGLEPEGAAPDGEILGVRVPDEEAKMAMLQSEPGIYFTTPHFDGHPSVLIRLERIPRKDLEEAIVEAWLTRAPKRVAAEYLAERGEG
ncbi:MAG TPA: MmcQ/YjbR family DNA-binding protein [Solirubrobacterales bacterium]|nr:MmcQ/YjbR family DNA-binding protein [Solirubrobacterales bacterium]